MEICLLRRDFGLVDYQKMQQLMADFNLRRGTDPERSGWADELWFLQHFPVFTLGRGRQGEHLLASGDIPVLASTRGGQITYHGPGQLLVYLMLDARRMGTGPRQLVTALEQAMIKVLLHFGVSATGRSRGPGVYVGERKLASLGLRISHGLVSHGLSFNVDMDLGPFDRISPCGYEGLRMTSLAEETGSSPGWQPVAERLFDALRQEFLLISRSPGSCLRVTPPTGDQA